MNQIGNYRIKVLDKRNICIEGQVQSGDHKGEWTENDRSYFSLSNLEALCRELRGRHIADSSPTSLDELTEAIKLSDKLVLTAIADLANLANR